MNEDTSVWFPTPGRTIILVSVEGKFIRIFEVDHSARALK